MPAVDVLLSNVGAPNPHGIDDITEEQWQRAVDINLKSGFFLTQAFLPLLRATGRGGSIIYTSSAAGLVGSYTTPLYSMTKAGLVGLTRSLCAVLAHESIRVNAVCPGPVNTPMLPGFLAKDTRRRRLGRPALLQPGATPANRRAGGDRPSRRVPGG